MTEPLPNLYVFASSNGELLGLSVKGWEQSSIIAMLQS